MAFTLQTLKAFEMTHREAACEIPATRPGHRAFVGVYPPWPEKNLEKWRIRKFEIPEHLIDQSFGERDLVNSQSLQLDTLEKVEKALAAWNIDTALFDAPWKSAYPL